MREAIEIDKLVKPGVYEKVCTVHVGNRGRSMNKDAIVQQGR